MRNLRIILIAGAVVLMLSPPTVRAQRVVVGEVKVSSAARPTDLIVYLADAPAAPKPVTSITVVMDQRNQTFQPHVLVILKGTTVKFLNSDRVAHNVFSVSPTKAFDLGKIGPNQFGLMTFEKPGVVEVLCGFHSRMLGYIRVMEHPYFGVPDSQGRFTIKNVPPGPYQLRVWHESLGEVFKEINVTADGLGPVQLRFPK